MQTWDLGPSSKMRLRNVLEPMCVRVHVLAPLVERITMTPPIPSPKQCFGQTQKQYFAFVAIWFGHMMMYDL